MVYFGKGCKFFIGIWEDPDHKFNPPKEAKCNEKKNTNSGCKFQHCPLRKPNVVNALHCFNCDSIVFSRAIDDIKACSCKSVFIKGGREQSKIRIEAGAVYENISYEIFVSDEELFNDWNNKNNKYGLIKKAAINHLIANTGT
ncbi:MAG: hypothetical protein GY714_20520 [Desulfobacterales bacterium]|nr:hypothetical protein [Desulfobacterales bacterium]MCP4163267.1 hypothetical protein [Deltaproteobacteria bacterium]